MNLYHIVLGVVLVLCTALRIYHSLFHQKSARTIEAWSKDWDNARSAMHSGIAHDIADMSAAMRAQTAVCNSITEELRQELQRVEQ